MFVWTNTDFDALCDRLRADRVDAETQGMVAGTKVATAGGWRPVEAICAGDKVLTFDGGLQVVAGVTRRWLEIDLKDAATWPMTVPAGALGNRETMQLLPAQPVMIESDLAEDLFDDPFALIPADLLDGCGGISRSRPEQRIEVIELHFDRDEIVFANIGALFLCRAKGDLLSAPCHEDYTVLPRAEAAQLVDHLFSRTARAFRADARAETAAYAAA